VQVNGILATRSGNSFQASIPLQEGTNSDHGGSYQHQRNCEHRIHSSDAGHHATARDHRFPRGGFTTTESSISVSGIVNDLVVGTVNDQQATVTVNGVTARVANRRYVLENAALAMGQ